MLKLVFRLFVLFCLVGHLKAASTSANIAFANTCNVIVVENTSRARVAYVRSAKSALYSRSRWVKQNLDKMEQNLSRFTVQASNLNTQYQAGNQYTASQQMRDRIATMITIINNARSVASRARVSNAGAISSEINQVVTMFQEVRQNLVQYTRYDIFLSWRSMSAIYPDKQLNKLRNAVRRASVSLNTVMQSVSHRVINDTNFGAIAFSLDFQLAVSAGNNALANTALSAQETVYNAGVWTSTRGAVATLNAQRVILDGYVTSIIVEFNGFGAYAQAAVNTLTNSIIRVLVSTTTVQSVFIPLGQRILTGLADAYIAVNGEFLIAIQDCKAVIESTNSGENGSESSDESNFNSDSGEGNNYSMKGEVRKCEKRGRGLLIAIQRQYRKSGNAAVCGAFSTNNIITRVVNHQARVAQCGVNLIVDFRLVLEQVKRVIGEEINKNLAAFTNCAQKAGDSSGSSKEVSQTCTNNRVDSDFRRVRSRGFALVKELKRGGKYIVKANNCRKNVRSSLVTQLRNVKGSFSSCSGVSSFSTTL